MSDGRDSDRRHEVLRRWAHRHFKRLLLGNADEEAARLAEFAPLGWWSFAEITGVELTGVAIRAEIQNPFARQRAIAGAVPPNFLAGCEDYHVAMFLNRAFQFALRRVAE